MESGLSQQFAKLSAPKKVHPFESDTHCQEIYNLNELKTKKMIKAIISLYNDNNKTGTFSNYFEDEPEMYRWLSQQIGHPFLWYKLESFFLVDKVGKRVYDSSGNVYRKRRGKLVMIPPKWVGQVVHKQTKNKRNPISRRTRKTK